LLHQHTLKRTMHACGVGVLLIRTCFSHYGYCLFSQFLHTPRLEWLRLNTKSSSLIVTIVPHICYKLFARSACSWRIIKSSVRSYGLPR